MHRFMHTEFSTIFCGKLRENVEKFGTPPSKGDLFRAKINFSTKKSVENPVENVENSVQNNVNMHWSFSQIQVKYISKSNNEK